MGCVLTEKYRGRFCGLFAVGAANTSTSSLLGAAKICIGPAKDDVGVQLACLKQFLPCWLPLAYAYSEQLALPTSISIMARIGVPGHLVTMDALCDGEVDAVDLLA